MDECFHGSNLDDASSEWQDTVRNRSKPWGTSFCQFKPFKLQELGTRKATQRNEPRLAITTLVYVGARFNKAKYNRDVLRGKPGAERKRENGGQTCRAESQKWPRSKRIRN